MPQELAILYNDYAVPHRLWELGLEMVALANFDDPAYIRQLWDVYLRQVRPTQPQRQHFWLAGIRNPTRQPCCKLP